MSCLISFVWIQSYSVYANYISPSVMTDANSEEFPICNERITENDRCVIKIIGIHCRTVGNLKQGEFTKWKKGLPPAWFKPQLSDSKSKSFEKMFHYTTWSACWCMYMFYIALCSQSKILALVRQQKKLDVTGYIILFSCSTRQSTLFDLTTCFSFCNFRLLRIPRSSSEPIQNQIKSSMKFSELIQCR